MMYPKLLCCSPAQRSCNFKNLLSNGVKDYDHSFQVNNLLQGALIDGAADPSPELWGKTTVEERSRSGIGVWPGITADVNPPNATLRLYGGAAFERVLHEFRCAAYSIECPSVSREKVIYFS